MAKTLQEYAIGWERIYQARRTRFGSTTTIIGLGDFQDSQGLADTTFNTRYGSSGSSQVVTWATAPGSFASPFKLVPQDTYLTAGLHGPAGIPGVLFGGVAGERLTVPDAAYWTRAATNPMTLILSCVVASNTGSAPVLFSKYDATGGSEAREWFTQVDAGTLKFGVYDETENVLIQLASDAAVATLRPLHLAFMYSGGTDMTASAIYVNGAAVAATASSGGAFVSMRDTAASVIVGGIVPNTGNQYNHIIHGACWGPTFIQANVNANVIHEDFEQWRADLGLGNSV